MGRLLKTVGRIVSAEVLGAREQATAIVAAANAYAVAVGQQAETAREEARHQGYEDGRDAAVAALTETLASAALEAQRARARAEPAAMRLAAQLAAKMTERIVGRALALSPALLAEIAAQALTASRARAGLVHLRVHPDDLAILRGDEARGLLLARLEAGAQLQLHADPAVGRHGCIVQTATVHLDARLETQIAALERALVGDTERG